MNLKSILLIAVLILMGQAVWAQEFHSHGASPNLHIIHKVAPKETWYSISRNFNLTPKEIASFNSLNVDTPLEIGQSIKIPLTSSNFSQQDPTGSVDDLVPVYHVVQEKEWMYRISVNHNKVPIEKLERWNNISREQAKAGTKLIVGFLLSKDAVASLKTTSDKTTSAVKTIPAVSGTENTPAPEGGYFRNQFDENGKNQTGFSGIFKSTSGWNDRKYYALMNNVTVGTIVKVSFPATNKAIYAKVLGELPDMRESAGLALRISDAAAKELGAVNNKFNVEVKY